MPHFLCHAMRPPPARARPERPPRARHLATPGPTRPLDQSTTLRISCFFAPPQRLPTFTASFENSTVPAARAIADAAASWCAGVADAGVAIDPPGCTTLVTGRANEVLDRCGSLIWIPDPSQREACRWIQTPRPSVARGRQCTPDGDGGGEGSPVVAEWRSGERRADSGRGLYSGEDDDAASLARIVDRHQTGPAVIKYRHYFWAYAEQLGRFRRRRRGVNGEPSFRMLEIGVAHGGSIGLWREWLGDGFEMHRCVRRSLSCAQTRPSAPRPLGPSALDVLTS